MKKFMLMVALSCFYVVVCPGMNVQAMENQESSNRPGAFFYMEARNAQEAANVAAGLFRARNLSDLMEFLYGQDGEVFGEDNRDLWRGLLEEYINNPDYASVVQLTTILAAGEGEEELVRYVLENNVNISCDIGVDGSTTMVHEAASKDQVKMLDILRELRPDTNFGYNNDLRESPLSKALVSGATAAAEWLVDLNQNTGMDVGLTVLNDENGDLLDLAIDESDKVATAIRSANGM